MRTLKGLLKYFGCIESMSNEYEMYTIKSGYTLTYRHTEDGDEWREDDTDLDIIYVSKEDGTVILDNDYELIDYADIDIIDTSTNKAVDF